MLLNMKIYMTIQNLFLVHTAMTESLNLFSKRSHLLSSHIIEFGAHNGVHESNTRNLLVNNDWSGLYIEPSLKHYLLLRLNTLRHSKAKCLRAFVSSDSSSASSLDKLWKLSDLQEPSFVSINVDGINLEIFSSINQIKPLVYCITGGQLLPPLHPLIDFQGASKKIQQSLLTIRGLAESQGYKILCSSRDTFLIRNDLTHLFSDYMTSDLCTLYQLGLIQQKRRIPWISKVLRENDLKNPIIDAILTNSNYHKYGYQNRFEWYSLENDIVPAIKSAISDYRGDFQ